MIVAILSLLVVGGGVYIFLFSDFPWGVRPTYVATDGDTKLTPRAKTALPVITALRQYHAQHNSFPKDAAELAPLVSPGVVSEFSTLDIWSYRSIPESDSFVLSLRLGRDPSLDYRGNATSGTWVFEPGDGSPEKPIVLNP